MLGVHERENPTAAQAETERVRGDAERQLDQARQEAARERDELRAELAQVRADAERQLDQAPAFRVSSA